MGAACGPAADGDQLEITQGKLGTDDKHVQVRDKLRREARELFSAEGTKVVILSAGGEEELVEEGRLSVLEISSPSRLVVLFVGESLEATDRGFYYPLLPATPACLSGNRVLTLDAADGDVFGVELPREFAEGGEQLQALVELLSRECALTVKAPPTRADRLAESLIAGGKKAAGSIDHGTEKASEGLKGAGEAVRQKVGKAPEESKVSEGTKLGVTGFKTVTSSVVIVTGAVVDGLMDMAIEVGKQVTRPSDGEKPKADGAVSKVTRAAGQASLQVIDALFRAGDRLATDLCNETAAVVSHRYGQEAGGVTREALDAGRDIGSVITTFPNAAVLTSRLGLKASLYTTRGLVEGRTGDLRKGDVSGSGGASSSTAAAVK